MFRTVRLFAALALVSLVCISAALASTPSLKSLVLRRSDLPAGFTLDYSRPVAYERAGEFGYPMSGWLAAREAMYSKTTVLPVLESEAVFIWITRYRSARDAHRALVTLRHGARGQIRQIPLRARIGDEAFAYIERDEGDTQISAIEWRYRDLHADITVVGNKARIDLAAGLALRQQARIGRQWR